MCQLKLELKDFCFPKITYFKFIPCFCKMHGVAVYKTVTTGEL